MLEYEKRTATKKTARQKGRQKKKRESVEKERIKGENRSIKRGRDIFFFFFETLHKEFPPSEEEVKEVKEEEANKDG